MRRFTLIFSLFIISVSAFCAQDGPETRQVNAKRETYADVDRLNNIAANIFLQYPDSAHKAAGDALLIAEKLNYPFGKGRSCLNLGSIYWSQSYYPISLFYLKSALTYLPKNKPLYLSEAYRALGRTYADLKNYKVAETYLDSALYFAGNDPGHKAEVYSERAYIDNFLGRYDKAIDEVNQSLELNRIAKSEKHIAVLYGRLASIYLHKKSYANALVFNGVTYEKSIETHNRRLLAYTYLDYALIYNGLHRYEDAVAFAQKSIALADSIGVMDAETRAFNALINTYQLKHQYAKALDYQQRYNDIRDSLGNLAKLKTIKLVQNYYDLNAKINSVTVMEVNDRLNKAKIKSQHVMIRVLLVSLIVVMIILTATYYFYKQKKLLSSKLQEQHKALLDQKQLIEAQTANLQKVNDLKDKLFAVIGHDLRSPVANLSNIIEMFEDGYLTSSEVHELMKNINPVVKGVQLTLSNLVEWAGSQIKGINVNSSNVDIFLLGVEMEQTFIPALQVKNLEFINSAYPGRGAVADENHLKVILRNLISNAIKFTPENGTITLGTTIENNQLIISVTDSGQGMSEDEVKKLFSINTHFSHSGTSGEKGTGIGLLLCKELVELNGGQLRVKSKLGKGSTFYFNLPLVKAYA
ncbi:MAG TPA: tetratricopeptide repeat-containing sensor histidine kinase [Mucilaginibacter sp.]|jgi:signal transduction histidine kinase|nr:tetratricopeptide repeat-containing sensor histidine kinase [Mucilaginibacter sp.]